MQPTRAKAELQQQKNKVHASGCSESVISDQLASADASHQLANSYNELLEYVELACPRPANHNAEEITESSLRKI